MHTDQFNHHPGQLMMQCGSAMFDRPTMGAWLNYGLGSESRDLPGYVVLTAGRGTSGGASLWSSGFLPSTYQGGLFRMQSAAPELIDLSSETKETLDAYGVERTEQGLSGGRGGGAGTFAAFSRN